MVQVPVQLSPEESLLYERLRALAESPESPARAPGEPKRGRTLRAAWLHRP